jgi:hypothetical protein
MTEKRKLPSIIYGPATPVPLNLTFSELLDHNVSVRGDRPAVISHPQDLTLSFRQLRERSMKLAIAMSRDGIGKNDFVAISLGSRVEYFEVRSTEYSIEGKKSELLMRYVPDILCLHTTWSRAGVAQLCLYRIGDAGTAKIRSYVLLGHCTAKQTTESRQVQK